MKDPGSNPGPVNISSFPCINLGIATILIEHSSPSFEKRNQRHRSPTMPGYEDNLCIVRPVHFIAEYQVSSGIVFEN